MILQWSYCRLNNTQFQQYRNKSQFTFSPSRILTCYILRLLLKFHFAIYNSFIWIFSIKLTLQCELVTHLRQTHVVCEVCCVFHHWVSLFLISENLSSHFFPRVLSDTRFCFRTADWRGGRLWWWRHTHLSSVWGLLPAPPDAPPWHRWAGYNTLPHQGTTAWRSLMCWLDRCRRSS